MNLREIPDLRETQEFRLMFEELRRYAKQIVAFNRHLRQKGITADDLVNDVVLREQEKPSAPEPVPERTNYLKRCIKNRAIDLWRKMAMESGLAVSFHTWLTQEKSESAKREFLSEPEIAEKVAAEIRDRLARALRLISAAFESASRKSGVNYYSVLMFQLRLTVAFKLRAGAADSPPSNENLPIGVLTSRLVPWDARANESSFRKDLPSLALTWEAMRPSLDDPARRLTIFEFCEIFNKLLAHSGLTLHLNAGLWYQWVKRAKVIARQAIDTDDWNRYLSHWLPDKIPISGKEMP